LSPSARLAIEGADRPGVLRKDDDAGLRRIRDIVQAAKLRHARLAAEQRVDGQQATQVTYDEVIAAAERLATRQDKIIHPSGDDGGDGSPWIQGEDHP
jgi:hypothetical protein